MRELADPRLLYLKAGLFVLLGCLCGGLLVLDSPYPRTLLLLAICVWAFARAYYFVFYVVERYVDPRFRYSGLFSLLRGLFTSGSHDRNDGATKG